MGLGNMSKSYAGIPLLLALTVGWPGAAAAMTEFVMNGSFEEVDDRAGNIDGDLLNSLDAGSGAQSWDVYDELPGGWTATSGDGIEIQTDATVSSVDPLTPPAGNAHYVELDSHPGPDSNSAMEQVIIGLVVGEEYEFSFYYSPRESDAATNTIDWDISSLASTLSSGSVSGPSAGPPSTAVGSWTQFTDTFTATDGTATLSFVAGGTENTLGGYIDLVSIMGPEDVTTSNTPVPVPAPLALLGAAVAGLLACRRRRNG